MDSINNINQSYTNTIYDQRSQLEDPTETDSNAFMLLLIETLKNQDPTQPISNAELMGQLTQLTLVETVEKMTKSVESLTEMHTANPLSNYYDLIGKYVRVENSDGFIDGKVISVGMQGKNLMFEMDDGNLYPIENIVGVSNEAPESE